MGKVFFVKLAFNNIKRNQKRLIPYFISAALMISIYFMVVMIIYSPGLANVPEHQSLKMLFQVGFNTLNIFIAVFMLYINSFLIKQRKKELGLYGILGLEKRHVGHVLFWENVLINGSALIAGIVTGCVFGWLIFMLLMKSVNVAVDSYFVIPFQAFIITLIYFLAIFIAITGINLLQIRLANPIDLLKSDHQGEKKSRFLIPITVVGLVAMGFAYYLAITVTNPLMALNQFFISVLLVIFATYALFISGSIFLLRILKRNKKYYYKPDNFVSVAGMLHRMKQNAAGLASICILSTMVLVTVSTCVALYAGQEDMLIARHMDDINIGTKADTTDQEMEQLEGLFYKTAKDDNIDVENYYHFYSKDYTFIYKNREFSSTSDDMETLEDNFQNLVDVNVVTLSDFNRICGTNKKLEANQIIMLSNSKYHDADKFYLTGNNAGEAYKIVSHLSDTIFTNGKNRQANDEIFFVVKDKKAIPQIKQKNSYEGQKYVLNIKAGKEEGYQYCEDITDKIGKITNSHSFDSIFTDRASAYSLYGGLLFMGAFFTVLFLCATVLIIYFKQISEGYEDKDRFEMLQKVGMDDKEVKRTINKQILIVFFLPLFGALLHLAMASHMIIKLLEVFMLYNDKLTILCLLGSSMIFTLVYVFVYRMTARTYCRIVRW